MHMQMDSKRQAFIDGQPLRFEIDGIKYPTRAYLLLGR